MAGLCNSLSQSPTMFRPCAATIIRQLHVLLLPFCGWAKAYKYLFLTALVHPRSKRMRLYNEKGELLESLLDICDCLDTNCAGCHFPCPRCNSSKCGTDCRCNRKYTINLIEVEGTDKTFSFSIEPDENKKATV